MCASMVLRSLRAAVFATVCVTLAAAGHSIACRQTPSAWAQGVGFAAVFALSCLMGGRERSLAGIVGTMGIVQVALHMLFDAAPGAPGTTMAQVPGMSGMSHPAMALVHHGESGRAIVAHAAAALVAAWWLRCGEAAIWSLLRQVATVIPGLVAWWHAIAGLPAPPSGAPVRRRDGEERRTGQFLLRHAVIRRGPPVVAAPAE
ncbi:hypothetical protein ACH427_18735 [Streptomyces sp. NPDC020379]|uniref:hypothetical protein n=1 Tax=Streptomyces sp. NPDC020379 TaxID=3365071 RepID=UPI0037B15A10